MSSDLLAFHVRITGKVQGVGYRVWSRDQAAQLGLTGWVRNESDGSVSALIVGTSKSTLAMLERFWDGPTGSNVSAVDPQATALDRAPDHFVITR
ncbi:acylphosphatase [Rhizobium sp. AC44/96]|uniref:acylphosphatase n=1 Tax=unclassified Rhizobium TaxID=2613769 RepID=UPI00080F8AD1|nr:MULTISPECIES: acylphosphatase [unclassified Rhizobium]MDM9623027.1 acylphosphatase [Rhizobium sp. S96]OCJ13092.1 acylphosphatase [Rhizobium sp. AC44/96]